MHSCLSYVSKETKLPFRVFVIGCIEDNNHCMISNYNHLTHSHIKSTAMDFLALILGLSVIFGGYMGYVRKGSTISFATGWFIGVFYVASAFIRSSNVIKSLHYAMLASALLMLGSVPRAIAGKKPVPVILSVVSTLTLFKYVSEYRSYA